MEIIAMMGVLEMEIQFGVQRQVIQISLSPLMA
jgi:hypothetical protein